MTQMVETKILDITPWVRCLSCGAPIQIDDKNFESFFEGCVIQCPSCVQHIDWWKTALREISENFMLNQPFGLVSARSTIFSIPLRPNQTASYKLTNFGIPPDAKVLYVNYSPQGNLFPAELHGNLPTVKTSRQEVYLWPVPPRNGDTPEDTKLNIFVTWVPHSQLDDSWKNMIASFEAYVANDYLSCVVPANVAVESSLSITLSSYLPRFVGNDRTKSFLKDAATYSHQLNVILPLLGGLLKLPAFPEHIRGLLNNLRGRRNEIVHLGATEKPLSKERCAELLCAALFGFQYVLLLRKKLLSET